MQLPIGLRKSSLRRARDPVLTKCRVCTDERSYELLRWTRTSRGAGDLRASCRLMGR
jgi:hypothetical protein